MNIYREPMFEVIELGIGDVITTSLLLDELKDLSEKGNLEWSNLTITR